MQGFCALTLLVSGGGVALTVEAAAALIVEAATALTVEEAALILEAANVETVVVLTAEVAALCPWLWKEGRQRQHSGRGSRGWTSTQFC